MKDKKVLITGGLGFIGSEIATQLVNQEAKVTILDNSNNTKNIEHIKDKVRIIKSDITNLEEIKQHTKDIDNIIHLAGVLSVPESLEHPEKYISINTIGTLNLLKAARLNNVKRIVLASSCAVYGTNTDLPLKENTELKPISIYPTSKIAAEHCLKTFNENYGIETVSLRYFNVYGPKQNPNSQYASAIPIFIKKILNNESPTIFGDGSQTRDFVHVSDIANATISSLKSGKANGETINIASGIPTTINKLIQTINKLTDKNIKPIHVDKRSGDVLHSLADISKSKEILNFKQKYNLEEGLKNTIEWYKK